MAALPGLLDPYAFRRTGTLYQISMAIDGVAKWELFECLILTQRRGAQSAQRGFAFAAGSLGVWEMGASGGGAERRTPWSIEVVVDRFVKKRRDAPRIELACGDGSGEPRAERPNHASTRGWARRAFAAEEFSKRFAAASNLSSLPGSNSAATPSSEHCVIAPA